MLVKIKKALVIQLADCKKRQKTLSILDSIVNIKTKTQASLFW